MDVCARGGAWLNLDSIQKKIIAFRNERNWAQFHDPKNLTEALSIEAGELLLERLLKDLNPLKVYGDVPAYNEEDDPSFENRERNIADFKSRDDRPVLIANPAACSESVSLHMACHDAIYLERTFNCGQFLQSMDRIHRVGMPGKIHPFYHIPIMQCAIEQVVDRKLRRRQQVLYRLLDDDMPVLGYEDESFLSDREDDLEEIFRELLEEISKDENKRTPRTGRRNGTRR